MRLLLILCLIIRICYAENLILSTNTSDTDGDGFIDSEDPFPNEPVELEKLGPNDFQPKDNVGWIEVTYSYWHGIYFTPGIWHPVEDNLGTWFPFDDTWSANDSSWPHHFSPLEGFKQCVASTCFTD